MIEGHAEGGIATIEVSNPVSVTARAVRAGNRMALDNIRQRLDLAFPGRASVEVDESSTTYRVKIRFPLVAGPAGAAANRGDSTGRAAENAALPMTDEPTSPDAIRTLIVDDEPPARDRLRRLLDAIDEVAVVGEAGSGNEALELCAQLAPDVRAARHPHARMDGIEAARHLNALEEPPAVIFTNGLRPARARSLRNPGRGLPAETGAPGEARTRDPARRAGRCGHSCCGSPNNPSSGAGRPDLRPARRADCG